MEPSLQRAWQLYRFRRYALALEETVKFQGQYPESSEAFCLTALIHGKEKRKKQAFEAAEAAIRYMPDWSYPHYVHALVAYWFNRYDFALRSLSEALRIEPYDPDFYELVSTIHAVKGHLNTSLEMAEKGLEHHAEHVGCLYQRGLALYNLNKRTQAEEVFRNILKIDTEHSPTKGFVGHFEAKQGRFANALPLLRSALQDNPDWELAQQAWKESLRGQYSSYAYIFRIKQVLFAKYWLVTFLCCFAFFSIMMYWLREEKGKLESEWSSFGMVGFALSCMLMAIVHGFLSSYLWLVSHILLLANRELRRSIDRKQFFDRNWKVILIVMLLAGGLSFLMFWLWKNDFEHFVYGISVLISCFLFVAIGYGFLIGYRWLVSRILMLTQKKLPHSEEWRQVLRNNWKSVLVYSMLAIMLSRIIVWLMKCFIHNGTPGVVS